MKSRLTDASGGDWKGSRIAVQWPSYFFDVGAGADIPDGVDSLDGINGADGPGGAILVGAAHRLLKVSCWLLGTYLCGLAGWLAGSASQVCLLLYLLT